MKNIQIAYMIAAFGIAMFVYQVHQISGLNEEAAVWRSQADALSNPGAGPFVRSFFDGLTFGAFADEGIFTEGKKMERAGNQLEATRASLLSRYESAVTFRNWGLMLGLGGGFVAYILRKKTASAA